MIVQILKVKVKFARVMSLLKSLRKHLSAKQVFNWTPIKFPDCSAIESCQGCSALHAYDLSV